MPEYLKTHQKYQSGLQDSLLIRLGLDNEIWIKSW